MNVDLEDDNQFAFGELRFSGQIERLRVEGEKKRSSLVFKHK